MNIKQNFRNYSKEHINKSQLSVLDNLILLSCVYGVPSETRSSNRLMTFNKPNYCDSYTSVVKPSVRYNAGVFGVHETSVYMNLLNNTCRNQTSSTQATASINKCFQVSNNLSPSASTIAILSTDYSTYTESTLPCYRRKLVPDNLMNPNIYFFGRKKDDQKQKGMGSKSSQTRLQKTSQTSTHTMRSDKTSKSSGSGSNASVQKPKPKVSNPVSKQKPVTTSKGAATAIGTSKTVTIKDEKQKPCPAVGGTTKGDMMVTVSHIRIGPKEICPTHGTEPCQGPKCILASSGTEQGPVKVTSVNNPRRGVFEIVIRKLTGAPLAKNELMLEWTPPPSRPPTCNSGPIPCLPPSSCHPSKCKLVVCRPSKPPKCGKKKPCGRPCSTCKKCSKPVCCGNPCGNPCKPCPPPSCCPTSPCAVAPCGRPVCAPPCKSSPCLRPCPIGRKRQRRTRSQPKIKSHHKRISPCSNRSKTCPVVRCRSVPDPCIRCYSAAPPFCLPRKCCSTVPCKPRPCASACSTCCG